SLGIGNYTETDVNEIARCFTGWTLVADDHAPGGYRATFVEGIHDTGAKTVLGASIPAGQTAQADGASVCAIVADHPACPPFPPPSVKGWDGGRKWVNTSTLLARHNFGALVATNRYLNYSNPAALVAASGATTAEGIVDYLLTLLGPLDVGSVALERFVDYMK